jgi:hypothetical protein
MKWPTIIVAAVVAGSPVFAQAPSAGDLKGRAVTLRACVGQGISNSVLLSRVEVRDADAAKMPARYLFDKPAAFADYLGGQIEIQALVREVKPADTELTMNDGVLAELTLPEQAVGTSGSETQTPVLKMDISKVRLLASVCR